MYSYARLTYLCQGFNSLSNHQYRVLSEGLKLICLGCLQVAEEEGVWGRGNQVEVQCLEDQTFHPDNLWL